MPLQTQSLGGCTACWRPTAIGKEGMAYRLPHDTLLCLTGMYLWRGEYDPFIRSAQTKFARYLIVVPLSTFHRLAELIGDPNGELIFLFHRGRCGSTLLTQVLSLSLGPFHGAIAVPSVTRCRCRRHRCAGGARQYR